MKNLSAIVALGACVVIVLLLIICSGGGGKVVVSGGCKASESDEGSPRLYVYIENSGSMDGYMCDGSQLKDAVYDYVSRLGRISDTVSLNYINSQVIPYRDNLKSYIKTLNPASFKQAGGNRGNSDIGDMLGMIIDSMSATDVSVFISDCILDIPAANSQQFLGQCQIDIRNAIARGMESIDGFSVEILKMSSEFKGNYYYQNGAVEYLDGVKRPYYIWILGSRNLLAKYNREVPPAALSNRGLSGTAAFTGRSEVPFEVKNHFFASDVVSPVQGKLRLALRADLASTLQTEPVILDKSNYKFSCDGAEIEDIKPPTAAGSSQPRYEFRIVVPEHVSEVTLSFNRPALPAWISKTDDATGTDINAHIDQTTGIRPLIEGVADAYNGGTAIASFKFTFKKR